jgi:hypothetical protein
MKNIRFEKIEPNKLLLLSDIIRNTLLNNGYTIKKSKEYFIQTKQYGKINYFKLNGEKRFLKRITKEYNAIFQYKTEAESLNARLVLRMKSEQEKELEQKLTFYINKYEPKTTCPAQKTNETQNH